MLTFVLYGMLAFDILSVKWTAVTVFNLELKCRTWLTVARH
uniref:Uncharacterized protein n=1 Tax=Anguilla anguilla TaxID=7936 RepID=A0A0E9V2F3_ANGAN